MASFRYGLNSERQNFLIFRRIVLLIAVLNAVDMLLTVLGICFLGMVEVNPLFFGMSGVTVLWFIFVKVLLSFFLLEFYSNVENNWFDAAVIAREIIYYFGFFVMVVYCFVVSYNLVGFFF